MNVAYSNNNRDATITEFSLPPGQSKLTLCTLQTQIGGDIANEATLTPGAGEAVSVVTTPESTAEITIPHAGGILADFCENGVTGYGLLVTGTQYALDGISSGVFGKVGIANGVNQMLTSGGVSGDYVVHPPGSGTTGTVDIKPGPGNSPLLSPIYQDLTAAQNGALYLSAAVGSLRPTQSKCQGVSVR